MTATCNPPGDAGPTQAGYNGVRNRRRAGRKETVAAPSDDRVRSGGSRTAELAAVSRARHLLRHRTPHIFEDPYAIHLLGDRWRRIVTSRLLDWLFSKIVMRKLVPISIQQLTRARFAEEALESAARNGVTQYVILGSGFDSFAFRRPDLDLTVFEVDRAAMIRLKRERLATANLKIPDRLNLVPFDFERGDLRSALTAAGFDLDSPSFFNWMGVTYYLTRAAILDNLERLADISSPGSEIVFDYLIAAECVPPEDRELFARLMGFVEKRGEPMISRFDPARVGAVLNSGNLWEIVGNESPADHHRKYLQGRTDLPPLAPITWCLHLRRRAAGS